METHEEVSKACALLGYEIEDIDIAAIAARLDEVRYESRNSPGGLKRNGCGVVPYVKNRLHEMGLLPPHCGKDSKGFFVIGRFHFFRACQSVIEWKDKGFEKQEQKAGVKRSPLSRLEDSSPIDRIARKVAGDGDRPCPYCNQYFRNPNAMILHIKERHQ